MGEHFLIRSHHRDAEHAKSLCALCLCGLFLLLCLPFIAQGQSTLNFPRAMAPGDFKTTGFAIVNPGPLDATATFTLYGSDATALGTSTQTIVKRGQISKLGSDLFPNATASGWVQATSSIAGLQGFWLGGDFA